MGDHRFSFKAEFEMHGHKDTINLGWCNWDGGRGGVDSRISSWLETAVDKAFAKMDRAVEKYEEERNREQTEKSEREMLAALKAKYEG